MRTLKRDKCADDGGVLTPIRPLNDGPPGGRDAIFGGPESVWRGLQDLSGLQELGILDRAGRKHRQASMVLYLSLSILAVNMFEGHHGTQQECYDLSHFSAFPLRCYGKL